MKFFSIPLLALLALSTAATAVQAGTVTLTGEGRVFYTPDAVRFLLTTQARGDSADEARALVRERVNSWDQAAGQLKGELQAYDDSQVTVTETPVYDDKGRATDESYFQARQMIRFNLTELDLLNRVIEAAESADLGYQLREDSYYTTEDTQLQEAALAAAIEDAQQRCRFIAEKLERQCGPVEELRVLGQTGGPRPMLRAMDAATESVSQVGDREISASVEVSFALD